MDFTASRLRWNNQIARWSKGGRAVLRRNDGGPDRAVVCCVVEFSPKERVGKAIDPEDRKAMVSALAPDGSVLTPEPYRERDSLIVFNPDGTEQPPYRLTQKPGREEPTAGLVLFWILQVRR